jgi:hypothetical protein
MNFVIFLVKVGFYFNFVFAVGLVLSSIAPVWSENLGDSFGFLIVYLIALIVTNLVVESLDIYSIKIALLHLFLQLLLLLVFNFFETYALGAVVIFWIAHKIFKALRSRIFNK